MSTVPLAAARAAAEVMRVQAADPGIEPERLTEARQRWWLDRASAVLAAGLTAVGTPVTSTDA